MFTALLPPLPVRVLEGKKKKKRTRAQLRRSCTYGLHLIRSRGDVQTKRGKKTKKKKRIENRPYQVVERRN